MKHEKEENENTCVSQKPSATYNLLLDSGASIHAISNRITELMVNICNIPPRSFTVANGQTITVDQMCDLSFVDLHGCHMIVTDTFISDKISGVIISTGRLIDKGAEVTLNSKGGDIRIGGKSVTKPIFNGKVHQIPVKPMPANQITSLSANGNDFTKIDIMTLHITLGHCGPRKIKAAIAHTAFGDVTINHITGVLQKCHTCMLVKMKKASHPSMRSNPPTQLFELIQANTSGPLPPTIGGSTSFHIIMDRASRYIHIDLAKSKAIYPEKIQAFVNRIQNQFRCKVKVIHTDGASEYNSAPIENSSTIITSKRNQVHCTSSNKMALLNAT